MIVPILAIYGVATTELQRKTGIWTFIYYFMTGSGELLARLELLVQAER